MQTTSTALIVDDDETIQYYHSVCLEGVGMHCSAAGSGEQALEMLGRKSYDLVLLDVGLPGIDGFEVLERIRAASIDVCVIMISGLDDPGMPGHAVASLGADLFMTKPCSPSEVQTAVREAMRSRGDELTPALS